MISELVATGAAGAALASWGTLNPRSRLFGPVIRQGRRDGRRAIYLTFDDGPNPDATPVILDVLERERVSAVFFMMGQHVHLFPEMARLVAARGHEIGNHTWSHVKLHACGLKRIRQELRSCHRTIREQTGVTPRFFRAPHGYRNPWVGIVTGALGYHTVAWNVGVWDTACPGAEVIRERVRRALRPGAIVLLHDGDGGNPEGNRMQTARALPHIIRDARQAGYEFRPLAELLP